MTITDLRTGSRTLLTTTRIAAVQIADDRVFSIENLRHGNPGSDWQSLVGSPF